MAGASLGAAVRPGTWARGFGGSAASRFDRGYLLGVPGIILAYYVAAHIGYAFQFAGPVAAVVWLPVGVGIAALYLGGLRFWPAVLLGDLLVNNYTTLPIGCAVAQSFGNLLEILVAVGLIRRLRPRGAPLETVGGTAVVVAGITAGTAVSAAIGALSLSIWSVVHEGSLLRVWRTWWLGDFSGALIILPLAIAWWNRESRDWLRGRGVEGAALLVALIGLSQVRAEYGQSAQLCRLPGADLGGAALRPARGNAGHSGRVGLRDLGHDALQRSVRLPLDFSRCARHPALHRRGCAVDADAHRRGVRAPGARCRTSRLASSADRRRSDRPASARTRSARRRPATADRPRGASQPGERRVGQGLIARPGSARRGSGRALACHR